MLLQRGAAHVVAIDVGRGQLDWRLRNDPRVLVREGVNARALAAGDLPHPWTSSRSMSPSSRCVTSFPRSPLSWHAGGDIVALVKPQFEAGRDEVGKHGLVTDPAVHEAVIERVTAEADASRLVRVAMTPSPITGATGNREFFLHLRAR